MIFQKHISKEADVVIDEWKSHTKITKDEKYKIEQLNSKGHSSSFFEKHTILHQVKPTIRTIYSWVSKKYVQNYLNEIAFRINRSLTKQTIVNNLLKRLVMVNLRLGKVQGNMYQFRHLYYRFIYWYIHILVFYRKSLPLHYLDNFLFY